MHLIIEGVIDASTEWHNMVALLQIVRNIRTHYKISFASAAGVNNPTSPREADMGTSVPPAVAPSYSFTHMYTIVRVEYERFRDYTQLKSHSSTDVFPKAE
jgi:hypothetical protein